ncbi:precorrin-4/cobalt-precorrin-4 C11-methyltransferase [Herbaspirillum sp. Sphag1AN]|uniref:precorrin-4 C(11)-methyltransferase n=1 Tax=unclassified Herbaspirillum TaxID=2624150 RepID=UPI00160FB4D9|nr:MULTISPECIES: precorrin-4 C(11)-methyltransferase [unclassified Herbaspirillum]MBB3213159.1 precorrin-4/cobalt-precorrin-4 C11-methyltransferase [Herbaspirillum sp. Sphag1AN]MBB3246356.1 precorrin-4/cobalt-precorrin-4 C11-methyltransferase [Herbaspirillum sp. Sphag64]
MKVYFVGAGPGAPDLITLRGARLLGSVRMVLYAGSLVPTEVLQHCAPGTELIDTAQLDLEQQQACYERAREQDIDVVRLHSGDPAIYGATAEQMRRLDALGIAYEVVPGVSSFTAAAATVAAELTKPEVSQTVILTRVSGRASAVPELESIARLAEHQSTMCIFLSGPHLKKIVTDLRLHYPDTTPVTLVYRATWPDQRTYQGTLGTVLEETKRGSWNLTTMMLVGAALDKGKQVESSLYSKEFTHLFRVVKKNKAGVDEAADEAGEIAVNPGGGEV